MKATHTLKQFKNNKTKKHPMAQFKRLTDESKLLYDFFKYGGGQCALYDYYSHPNNIGFFHWMGVEEEEYVNDNFELLRRKYQSTRESYRYLYDKLFEKYYTAYSDYVAEFEQIEEYLRDRCVNELYPA